MALGIWPPPALLEGFDQGVFRTLASSMGLSKSQESSVLSLIQQEEAGVEGKVDFKPVSLKNPLLFRLSSIRMYRPRNWMFYSNGAIKKYAGVSPV